MTIFDRNWRENRLKKKKLKLEAMISAFDRLSPNFKSVPERLISRHFDRVGQLAVVEDQLFELTGIHK